MWRTRYTPNVGVTAAVCVVLAATAGNAHAEIPPDIAKSITALQSSIAAGDDKGIQSAFYSKDNSIGALVGSMASRFVAEHGLVSTAVKAFGKDGEALSSFEVIFPLDQHLSMLLQYPDKCETQINGGTATVQPSASIPNIRITEPLILTRVNGAWLFDAAEMFHLDASASAAQRASDYKRDADIARKTTQMIDDKKLASLDAVKSFLNNQYSTGPRQRAVAAPAATAPTTIQFELHPPSADQSQPAS